ncbi:MAG: hypothetical protein AVDCRST_MAG40-970 [uncultured Gemmatimonadaceae bacterium]|uniref:Uncharacterized protein n=1 Tax=uncultured Gemmatimonadaceae bacterium TaxID=246130 RepID=A0A6J4KT78_9BACT|nr:MAG: hypothetical protein AVDCRST_MAG40-970 [uncultured Gemmatimonadaceae bacterium]
MLANPSPAGAVGVDDDSGDRHRDQGGYGNNHTICCLIRFDRCWNPQNRG